MSPSPRPAARLPFLLLALVLIVGGWLAVSATGAEPESATVSQTSGAVTWSGKKNMVGPATRSACSQPGAGDLPNCDDFLLTVDLDQKFWEANNGGVQVEIGWEDPTDNFNMAVYDKDGNEVVTGVETTGTEESVVIPEPSRAGSPYRVIAYVNNVGGGPATYTGAAELKPIADVGSEGGGAAIPTEPVSGAPCTNGKAAGVFPCKETDLESFLPLKSMTLKGDDPAELNDIWGWTDPQSGKEYAIVGKTNGTSFVDVSDARAPRYLGDLPTRNIATPVFNIWRDMKVYKDHAFIVSEEPAHGMQVFDLKRLRGVTSPQKFDEDASYDGFGSAHNIALNEQSGFAYAIGTRTCGGGSHIVDVRDPQSPKPAGCVAQDLYTHDNQCVIYDGPDKRYSGREICFDYNEDSLTIVDVTTKALPRQISKIEYDGSSYTHQGWLTADMRFALANDELDEQDSDVPTTTYIFNVERLDQPRLQGRYRHPTAAIDHNNYVKGNRAFQSNYRSGLRILDTSKAEQGTLETLGFFDVYPADDAAEFNGSWSNYPYFGSGNVIVTGIEQGLFVVRPSDAISERGAAPRAAAAATPAPSSQPTPASSSSSEAVPSSCRAVNAFRSTTVRRRGRRGLELSFVRPLGATAPVSVDVFQQSRGRRVVGERLVARFPARAGAVRWNGRANRRGRKVTDGYYVARYRTRTPQGVSTRRVALRRVAGRWSTRPAFDRRLTCDVLRSFKLERPVFGGRTKRALGVSYRVTRDARVRVTVLRGRRVIRRFAPVAARPGQTRRVRLGAAKLRRGDYRVRVTITPARGRAVTSTLTSRRL